MRSDVERSPKPLSPARRRKLQVVRLLARVNPKWEKHQASRIRQGILERDNFERADPIPITTVTGHDGENLGKGWYVGKLYGNGLTHPVVELFDSGSPTGSVVFLGYEVGDSRGSRAQLVAESSAPTTIMSALEYAEQQDASLLIANVTPNRYA